MEKSESLQKNNVIPNQTNKNLSLSEQNLLINIKKMEQANYFFALSGKIEDLYKYLETKMNLYLPKITSKCLTENYLEKVLKREVIVIENHQKKPFVYFGVATKQEIIKEIQKILSNILDENYQKRQLGFDETCPPDKLWLQTLLIILNDKHPLVIPPKNYLNQEILEKLEPKYSYFVFMIYINKNIANYPI